MGREDRRGGEEGKSGRAGESRKQKAVNYLGVEDNR
jgi:hypothetical protein